MKKIGLIILAIAVISTTAHAARTSSAVDALDALVKIVTISRVNIVEGMYKGSVTVSGTFNSGTLHLLKSVDSGTTKVPVMDSSDAAYTRTTAGTFLFEDGWPTSYTQDTIYYFSVSGASSAPDITVTVDDNR